MGKVCLVIIDGFGIPKDESCIGATDQATFINSLCKADKFTKLFAHGQYVGLLDGMVGNSEVGHMTIGAGRVVKQAIALIDDAFNSGELRKNILNISKKGKTFHLIGLFSDGGVHSHIKHLRSLIDIISPTNDVYLHCIADGIDVPPNTAFNFASKFDNVVSISGRYYAMDRDKNWDRTKMVFDVLTNGRTGKQDISEVMQEGISDEFIKPCLLRDCPIRKEDIVIMFNYRADRAKQLYSLLKEFCETHTLFEYFDGDPNSLIRKPLIENTLPEWLSKHEVRQMHIAESEKYAHVTYFFNGGRDFQYNLEERTIIPSPKVDNFEKTPALSMVSVADECIKSIKEGYEFIVVNLAGPDLIGHTGNLEKVKESVGVADRQVERIYKECLNRDYALFITSDHGNSEQMVHNGTKVKSHTKNKVPLIVLNANRRVKDRENGSLRDISPSILKLLGVPVPEDMTGSDLIA